MSTKKEIKKEPEGNAAKNKKSEGFSDFEKDAMKERARELKAACEQGGRRKRCAREDHRNVGTGPVHG